MNKSVHCLIVCCLLECVFSLVIPASVLASDHLNLESGIPVQLEDAYPTAYGNREAQGIFRYDRTADDENRFNLVPIIEYGILNNTEVELEVPFYIQPGEDTGSGDIRLSGLYNFNQEGLILPAASMIIGAALPTGVGSAGIDPEASLILTKTLSRSTFFHRIHLNASVYHNSGQRNDEADDRYSLAFGYQVRLDPNNQFILNYYRELEINNDTINLLEAGLRHQWDPLSVVALGVSAGLDRHSPDARITLAFQRALNLFYDDL